MTFVKVLGFIGKNRWANWVSEELSRKCFPELRVSWLAGCMAGQGKLAVQGELGKLGKLEKSSKFKKA